MGQDNRVKELEEKILQLEAALKNTYVYDTDTLWCRDGELYIYYNDDKMLVMNVDQLFRDLPSIISMVTEEQKKMQKMHHKMIKETLTEI